MNDDILIRAARADDAGGIVALIRGSFGPELQNAMIYGCHGIERFIVRQIEVPAGLSDTIYLVAAAGDRIVGCVELRWLPEALFLNYICTHPEARSRGLAGRLLAESIRTARGACHRQMLLDVFDDNLPARTWYERLGFRHDYATQWWDVPIDVPAEAGAGRIAGFPQAMVSQEQYGFSTFRVLTTEREYTVGRMGNDWFRVTQPELLCDPKALSMLRSIDGKRRILALLRENGLPVSVPGDARLIVTSRRMTMDLDRLVAHLTD